MISYENLWETMAQKKITKYALIYYYNISSNQLRRLAHGENISISTLNELCIILHCEPEDILSFKLTDEEKAFQEQREKEIAAKRKRPQKS